MRTYFGVRDPYTGSRFVMVQDHEDFHHLRHMPRAAAVAPGREDWPWGSEEPAGCDLSRWLLADVLRLDVVEDAELVEAFAEGMVWSLPRESWELCEAEVQAWVYLYGASR